MSSKAEPAEYNIPPEHAELWRQLQEFVFDEPGAEYNFSKRLAKRNKWEHDFALRVIEEYRKFLFLLKAAGHMVTPSIVVDEAWHLHLIYTYSYWEVLCTQIFKVPMHHHPGNGLEGFSKAPGEHGQGRKRDSAKNRCPAGSLIRCLSHF